MLVSATARLWRYETTYGLTVLRLMAYAGLALVAAMLAWRALTLWVQPQRFVLGALTLLSTTLLSLAVLSPERFIAEHNLELTGRAVDIWYLQTLGADYLRMAQQAGIGPELLHRVAVMAAGGMDTLPHCGAIITLLSICKLTHRQSYADVAAVTMLFPLPALVLVITLGSVFGSF